MNNLQTEKSLNNKKNGQRAQSYQNGQASKQTASKKRGSFAQEQNRDQQQEASISGAMSMIPISAICAAVTSQMVDNFAPRLFEDIKDSLMEQFGKDEVEAWMIFFNGEEAGDKNAIYTLIRNAAPTLPEELSFSSIMDWDPIKTRVTKSPISGAAAVAASVGALYLTREMLKNGTFSFGGLDKVVKSGKAKLNAASRRGKKYLARKTRGSKKTAHA